MLLFGPALSRSIGARLPRKAILPGGVAPRPLRSSGVTDVGLDDPGLHDTGLDEAVAVARRVRGWEGRRIGIEPLPGGITNRNYVVRVDGVPGRSVLRLAGKDTHLLGIDRRTELAAATHAAAIGWAPGIVDFVEPEGYLVTRFLDAAPVPDLMAEGVVGQVGELLRAVHAGPPLATTFDCFQIPRTYARTASARGVIVPSVLDRALAIADRIEVVFAARPEPTVPAHNDLLNANFLRSEDGHIWLIDWEYAGMNSRWFDLGNLATNNGLDGDGRAALLRAYAGAVTSGSSARIELMQVMSDLREAMWGVVQQGLSTIPFDYVDYAQRHFDRLLGNATHPAFERALVAATKN